MISKSIEKPRERTPKRKHREEISKMPAKRRKQSASGKYVATNQVEAAAYDALWNTFSIQRQRVSYAMPGIPMGNGTMKDPYRIPLRSEANSTGCVHCPMGIEACACHEIEALISKHLDHVYTSTKLRRSHAYGRNPLNSKSVLPVFVSRLSRICQVDRDDVVWDLGCGIGSVVMQFALETGADAIGVDIQGENIVIARKTWAGVKREWMKRYPKRPVGKVLFIANDIFAELAPHVGKSSSTDAVSKTSPPTVVWAANLLFTPSMNNELGMVLHQIRALRSVACMVDIYPHNRSGVSKKRDPEPYAKFPHMEDHISQADCYEWTETEKRLFYTYQTRKHGSTGLETKGTRHRIDK